MLHKCKQVQEVYAARVKTRQRGSFPYTRPSLRIHSPNSRFGSGKKKWPGIKLRTTVQNEAPHPGFRSSGLQLPKCLDRASALASHPVKGRFSPASPPACPTHRSTVRPRGPGTSLRNLTFVFQSPARHRYGDG